MKRRTLAAPLNAMLGLLLAANGWSQEATVYHGFTHLDPASATAMQNAFVVVQGDRIARVGSGGRGRGQGVGQVTVGGLGVGLLVRGGATAPRCGEVRWGALRDLRGAARADGLERIATEGADVLAEVGAVGVRHDDADLRPRLDDDAAGGGDRLLDEAGLAGVGDLGVEHVAHEVAVGEVGRHGGGVGRGGRAERVLVRSACGAGW